MKKTLGGLLADAYTTWLSPFTQCCGPLSRRQRRPSTHDAHDLTRPNYSSLDDTRDRGAVLQDQPAPMPQPFPSFESFESFPVEKDARPMSSRLEKACGRLSGKSVSSTRTNFSMRHPLFSSRSSRRPPKPTISPPTDFRHVASHSFQFPNLAPPEPYPLPIPQSAGSSLPFEPLKLDLDEEMSPIFPHLDGPDRVMTPPAVAHLRRSQSYDADFTLNHVRSNSSMTFHLPRRQLPEGSSLRSHRETPSPPPIPPKARARAYTSPNAEKIAERIASALVEKEKLQSMIDDVVERQSIYLSSRPSTAYSMAPSMSGMEPMPAIPALPATGPSAQSFSERLSPLPRNRPSTSPNLPSSPAFPLQPRSPFTASPAPYTYPTPPHSRADDTPLRPPLPLVLRPPLRKKKSFSRVSTWLFPAGDYHSRDLSIDSITNRPQPVTDRDGFYQCMDGAATPRQSVDSDSTGSTWETADGDRTVPTTSWSPASSPATKDNAEGRPVFGLQQKPPVGVAF